MELKYLTRDKGPMSYGTRLGVDGVIHATENHKHAVDVLFEIVVDYDSVNRGWLVVGIFSPRMLDGTMTGGHIGVIFGREDKFPFESFEVAFAFCKALSNQFSDKKVQASVLDGLWRLRGMSIYQWIDEKNVEVTVPKIRTLH